MTQSQRGPPARCYIEFFFEENSLKPGPSDIIHPGCSLVVRRYRQHGFPLVSDNSLRAPKPGVWFGEEARSTGLGQTMQRQPIGASPLSLGPRIGAGQVPSSQLGQARRPPGAHFPLSQEGQSGSLSLGRPSLAGPPGSPSHGVQMGTGSLWGHWIREVDWITQGKACQVGYHRTLVLQEHGGQQATGSGGGDGHSHLHRVMGELAIWHSNSFHNQPDWA